MITLLLTSRVKDNKDSNIDKLLSSLVDCGGNKENCEVLIKYDNDDTTSSRQGKEYEESCHKDTEYRCPKNPDGSCPPVPDMSQYIKKDAIPCYGCSLDY
jgi:hypothetical protein